MSRYQLELTATRKHKVSLLDYDYKQDVKARLLLSHFTVLDYAVLEEILFSPIRTSIRKIGKNLDLSEEDLTPILQKIASMDLISFEEDTIVVDKERRKYFETELEKFGDDFQPGMDFLQQLLKKVPIHILPHWYAIPRTSNHIFNSLIEKYLLTPQLFQRHLLDLNFSDPVLTAIAQDIFKAPGFEISARELQKKYSLSPQQFQEAILYLEFHFICTIKYRKQGNGWDTIVTPFYEWKEHLTFLKETATPTINDPKKIERLRPTDFAFVEDITTVLTQAKKQSFKLSSFIANDLYLKRVHTKIETSGFARLEDGKLSLTDIGREWLDLRLENKALYLYRLPVGQLHSAFPLSPLYEKVVREMEKSILRVLDSGWVRFSDFLKGTYVQIREGQAVTLRKTGKHWRYQRPTYTPEEAEFLKAVITSHLFEAGLTAVGSMNGEVCFCITPLGQSLFG